MQLKKILLGLFALFFTLSTMGQLTSRNNCIRSGDQIIKQQVQYKDPGRDGENVIWDFSNLTPINPEYKLRYLSPELINDSIYILGSDTIHKEKISKSNLIIGVEHSTMYYYQINNDTVWCIGHENPVTLMHHLHPIPILFFSLGYKQSINKKFKSEGIYSSKKDIQSYGNIRLENDAYGKMILPSGDTLNNVTRIKTIQVINDSISIANTSTQLNDIKTVFQKKTKNTYQKYRRKLELNTYSWYMKGYRYPVFETVQSFEIKDSTKTQTLSIAYFYPPIDHYYLEEDPANIEVLDSLNNLKHNIPPTNWIQKNFTYNYGPNPVSGTLMIEYHLEENARVGITLYNLKDGIIKKIPPKERSSGFFTETIDCHGLYPGTYILKFDVKDEFVADIIIKQ